MIVKLVLEHQELKLYICIVNDNPLITLAYSTERPARSLMNLNAENV